MRTTLDLDPAVLRELKKRQQAEGKSLGRLASELLAGALAQSADSGPAPEFSWATAPMAAKVDLEDKHALHAALDEPQQ